MKKLNNSKKSHNQKMDKRLQHALLKRRYIANKRMNSCFFPLIISEMKM